MSEKVNKKVVKVNLLQMDYSMWLITYRAYRAYRAYRFYYA